MSVSRVSAVLAPRSGLLTLALSLAVLATCAGTAGAQESNGLWVAPERAARQTDPTPPTVSNIKHGRSLFQRECELCHGKSGKGDGMQAAYLQPPKPADLTSEKIQSQSDGAIFYKITEGRGQMPKAKLNDAEKWAVIEYVRTLAKK